MRAQAPTRNFVACQTDNLLNQLRHLAVDYRSYVGDERQLKETLLDLEESLHAHYLELKGRRNSSVALRVRQGLDQVLDGLQVLAKVVMRLWKDPHQGDLLKLFRKAEASIRSGKEMAARPEVATTQVAFATAGRETLQRFRQDATLKQ